MADPEANRPLPNLLPVSLEPPSVQVSACIGTQLRVGSESTDLELGEPRRVPCALISVDSGTAMRCVRAKRAKHRTARASAHTLPSAPRNLERRPAQHSQRCQDLALQSTRGEKARS
eukprot:2816330-Rhodomonas_salina.8